MIEESRLFELIVDCEPIAEIDRRFVPSIAIQFRQSKIGIHQQSAFA
jgi:hypothetical protein